ncbi:hypothetical protein LTR08_003038 [Meristemomyces frigidus]|nr:hypothetical protein LTR08_003038 [Meristemomyces frigidus]
MGTPGYVQHPDGRPAAFTKDKEAYFQQHPETYEPTLAAARAHAYARRYAQAQHEAHELWQKDQKAIAAEADRLKHDCIGGKIPKNCGKCRASFAAGLTCGSCNGTKMVWEPCGECKRLVSEADVDVGLMEEVK